MRMERAEPSRQTPPPGGQGKGGAGWQRATGMAPSEILAEIPIDQWAALKQRFKSTLLTSNHMRRAEMSNFKLIALILAFAGAGGWYLGGKPYHPSMAAATYEECMVAEMRGQPDIMYGKVDNLCSRRSSREVSIILRHEWGYSIQGRNIRAYFSKETLNEYSLTRGTFKASTVSCESAKPTDYNLRLSGLADEAGTILLSDSSLVGLSLGCLRVDTLYGRYK